MSAAFIYKSHFFLRGEGENRNAWQMFKRKNKTTKHGNKHKHEVFEKLKDKNTKFDFQIF